MTEFMSRCLMHSPEGFYLVILKWHKQGPTEVHVFLHYIQKAVKLQAFSHLVKDGQKLGQGM